MAFVPKVGERFTVTSRRTGRTSEMLYERVPWPEHVPNEEPRAVYARRLREKYLGDGDVLRHVDYRFTPVS